MDLSKKRLQLEKLIWVVKSPNDIPDKLEILDNIAERYSMVYRRADIGEADRKRPVRLKEVG